MNRAQGPLGALPALTPVTRRALVLLAVVFLGDAVATVALAWGLATAVAVGGSAVLSGALAGSSAGSAGFSGGAAGLVDGAAVPVGVGTALGVAAAAVALRAVLGWVGPVLAARAAAAAKRDLRRRALDAALARGPEFVAAHGPDELTHLCTTGLDAVDDYFTTFLPALVSAAVTVPVLGIAVLATDPFSAVLIAVTVALMPVFAALVGWSTRQRVDRAAQDGERLAGWLGELIRALPVLTAFGRAAAQVRTVEAVARRQRRSVLSALRLAFCSSLALELVGTLGVGLVAVGIGLRMLDGGLGLATGLLVLVLAPDCYLPVRAVGAAYHASADGLAAVERVATVVGGRRDPGPNVGVRPGPLGHQLLVRGLTVTRRGRAAPSGANLVLRPGSVTRLDTPSGSGKSTIMAVLLGFVAPAAGSVTVDGLDLAALNPVAWRRQVAWVPQRPLFAAATVADELRAAVADLDGCAPDTALVEVCERVHAHQLLHRAVGGLSAGERGRVALARALLRIRCGATVLLADEPTAHLDPLTAAAAMRAIQACAADGVAVLLASHRETTDAPAPLAQPEISSGSPAEVPPRLPVRLVTARTLAGVGLGALAALCGVALTATAAWLIARAAGAPLVLTLTVAMVAVRTFGLGRAVLRYVERLVTHDAALRTATTLRTRLWAALARTGPAATATVRATDGAHRLVSDVDAVRDAIPRVVGPPAVALVVGAAAVAVQTVLLPAAGAVLAAALVVAGVAGPLLGSAAARHAETTLAADLRRLHLRVRTLFGAVPDLLANGADRALRRGVGELDDRVRRRTRRQAFGAGIATGVATAALGMAAVAGLLLGVRAGADPVLLPVLALIPLACREVVAPLADALTRWRAVAASRARIATVLDAPAPSGVRLTRGADIALHGVTVGWPGGPPVLRAADLTVPRGAWVAVTGPSGCGKSTLIALMLGFLDPSAGHAAIPDTVAYCPQDAELISTTLAENLRLADPAATDDALAAVLTDVGLTAFAARLAEPVAAATVSGGEASRIALARALLAAPAADAVLLDEPTAHLDTATAAAVLDRCRARLAGRTVVLVTHDPAEAARADMIVEVRDAAVRIRSGAHW